MKCHCAVHPTRAPHRPTPGPARQLNPRTAVVKILGVAATAVGRVNWDAHQAFRFSGGQVDICFSPGRAIAASIHSGLKPNGKCLFQEEGQVRQHERG